MTDPIAGLLAEIAFGTEANAMLAEPVMACLAGFVGGVRATVSEAVGADRRTAELLTAANVRELEPVALAMAWRIDHLWTQSQEGPGAADGFAVGRAYGRSRMLVADIGMRGFLRRAAVRAFDADVFARGETLRLFALLSQLTRPEIEALGDLTRAESPLKRRLSGHGLLDGSRPTPIGEFVTSLVLREPESIPEGWVPPWERAVALSTGE